MSAQDLALREDALIGRGRRPAVSGRYFNTLDPATEQTLAQVAEGESADVNEAVDLMLSGEALRVVLDTTTEGAS